MGVASKNNAKTFEIFTDIADEIAIDDTTSDVLDKAWKLLGNQCSKLLEGYYYKKIALKELATTLGKSDIAVRKQKQRCLETLRIHFIKYYNN